MGLLGRLFDKLRGRDRLGAAKLVAAGVKRAQQGQVEAALRLYRRAARADHEYALARLNIGLALQDLFNRDRAQLDELQRYERLQEIAETLDLAFELDPELPAVHLARAYVQQALCLNDQAQISFETFLQIAEDKDPKRAEVQRDLAKLQTSMQAEQRRSGAVATSVDEQADPQQLADARAVLQDLVADDNAEIELWWALGVVQRRLDDSAGAIAAFERCLDLDAASAAAHREISSIAFKAERYEVALEHARRAYQLVPTEAGVVCNLGVCFLHLGQTEPAREYIELAHELDPDDAIIQNCLAELNSTGAAAGDTT